MGYYATIIADTVSPAGVRLTTMEVRYPRIILAELNTHKLFSRNTASSRAIPVLKQIQRVREEPYVPLIWAKNGKGMQASVLMIEEEAAEAKEKWMLCARLACNDAEGFCHLGLHKQWANRLLEPFSWVTQVITATEWENFFKLRCTRNVDLLSGEEIPLEEYLKSGAQPEMQMIANLMFREYSRSIPVEDTMHLPYIRDWHKEQDLTLEELLKISSACCARVSYLTQDGRRDVAEDYRLHDQLVANGHWSPLEHPAFAQEAGNMRWSGCLFGWTPYRKTMPGESGSQQYDRRYYRKF